jgi:hypothetical protein
MSVYVPRVRDTTATPPLAPVIAPVIAPVMVPVMVPVIASAIVPAIAPVMVPTALTAVEAPASEARKVPVVNTRLASFVPEDYFGQQPTPTAELPDPGLLAENLARSVLEILAGARELDQIARWVTDDVFALLMKRVHISQRARALKNLPAHRPTFIVGRTLTSQPADGIIEAVVIIHGKARTRSVAIRLEGLDNRWRASAVHVL